MNKALTALAVSVLFCSLHVSAAIQKPTELPPPDYLPRNAGVWSSNSPACACDSHCQRELVQQLRRLTGWQQLHFTATGKLELGQANGFEQGSATARQILQNVWQAGNAFVIENHPRSSTVHFGQLDEGLCYEDMQVNKKFTIWRVRLDLHDFQVIQASREVRAAFDPGFTLLHELLHGLGYHDAHEFQHLGECETIINQARAELGLAAQRAEYFADSARVLGQVVCAKLRFRVAQADGRLRNEWLFFMPYGVRPEHLLGEESATQNLVQRRRVR